MAKPNIDDVSPMMQHYLKTKDENPGCLLFYRLGDFYEMFFDDAVTVSRELDLTLTGKACGMEERAPMCGIPFHAVDGYVARLVEKGYNVAICEQVEDPRTAKGMVKREVTKIVTPGTNTSPETLDETKNNYIVCLYALPKVIGIASSDVSTGAFYVTEAAGLQKAVDEVVRYAPAEILCNQAFAQMTDIGALRERLSCAVNLPGESYFQEDEAIRRVLAHFSVSSPVALGIDGMRAGEVASGCLLRYLRETQKNDLENIRRIEAYSAGRYMLLDAATRRNLELTETLREKKKKGSLLGVLDRTRTAMGARMLHRFLEQPLVDAASITRRHDAVEALCEASVDRDEIREYLQPIYDCERLLTKVSYGSANPRDVLAFRESLRMIKPISQVLSAFPEGGALAEIRENLGDFEDLVGLLDRALVDDPPLAMKDGGIIKDGYLAEIDSFRNAKTEGKQWLADLEEADRNRTGIKNLKIKYNNVFGYFFEVTNSFKHLVPADFERKQTLVGSERYTTPRLKELEDLILNASDKLGDLEYETFVSLREAIKKRTGEIQKAAEALALLDVYCSLSIVAERNRYVRPTLNDRGVISIKEGRHPVVESMMDGEFIANDTLLDGKKNCVSVITGPNMAGKSTYMRQVALITLMNQIGSFVPAAKANLCVVDRIFTRVGASDDLSSGQSTFMVEMNEVANILRNATRNSLLILDEIGRGTSTYDGLSIAWAVIEYVADKRLLGAKTLFATHYHELTELEGKMDNVRNYCVAVQEDGDDIVFLRRIIAGGADRSYGIQVAKLAGIPDLVIARAKEIAQSLADGDMSEKIAGMEVRQMERASSRRVARPDAVDMGQMSFFDTKSDDEILKELKDLDVNSMTPLDALNTLYRLKSEVQNRYGA